MHGKPRQHEARKQPSATPVLGAGSPASDPEQLASDATEVGLAPCGARAPDEVLKRRGREQRELDAFGGIPAPIYRGKRAAKHEVQITLTRLSPGEAWRTW